MKIFEKFPSSSGYQRESIAERSKRNLLSEISIKGKNKEEISSLASLNEATLYFSRHQSEEKVNGVEEAFKLLNEMTRYLESTVQEGNASELTQNMNFDTKKIAAIFSN